MQELIDRIEEALDDALLYLYPEDGLAELRPAVAEGYRPLLLEVLVRRLSIEPEPENRSDLLTFFYFLHIAPHGSLGTNLAEQRAEMQVPSEILACSVLEGVFLAALSETDSGVLDSYAATLSCLHAQEQLSPDQERLFQSACRHVVAGGTEYAAGRLARHLAERAAGRRAAGN